MARLLLLFLSVVLLIAPCAATAEPFDPLLAPHAEKYSADVQTLRAKRKMEVAQVEKDYVLQLDAALKQTTDEKLKGLLKKERDGVVGGLLITADSEGLPEPIIAARKAFLEGANRAAFAFNKEKKVLDDAYLKTLTGLTKQAKSKTAHPGLSAQIVGERRRVTRGY